MEGSDFIFGLQDKDFNFWNFGNGVPYKSSQPYFLKYAPVGWEDIAIQNVRNKKYWGVDRSVTIPLSYVEDGAGILKYIFYTLGIEEDVYLVIANQRLFYDVDPEGEITFGTGGNPLFPGLNTGTIAGPPNTTVYMRFIGSPSSFTSGTIGSVAILPGLSYYSIPIPATGFVTYSIIRGAAFLQMQMVNSSGDPTSFYGYWYKRIYRSQIDLSTFIHQATKVTCTCLEDGLPKYLKANEGTVFEFPMNVPEAVWVKADGINLHEKGNFNILAIQDRSADSAGYEDNKAVAVTLYNTEGDHADVLIIDQSVQQFTGSDEDYLSNTDNYSIRNQSIYPVAFTISGNVTFQSSGIVGSGSLAYRLYFKKTGNVDYVIFDDDLSSFTTYNEDFSFDIVLNPGEKLILLARFDRSGIFPNGFITFLDDSNYHASFISRHAPTYIRALRAQYLYELLIKAVGEQNFTADQSAYLEKYKDIVFTSGNAIRGFDDATIKISLADFFKHFDSFDSVGIQEKAHKVYFDTKKNLIDPNNIIDFPEIMEGSLKVSFDKTFAFNELHVGYPPISNEVGALNGNEEFNDQMIFSLGATKTPAVLDKVSPIKASCYEIEKIRVTTIDKNTTDYKTDNSNYILAIENVLQPASGLIPAHYQLDRSLNASATGLIEPETVFNLPCTPKRMLLRNGAYMRSILYLSDTKTLKFISADKNNKLACGGIVEKADENIGSMETPFFWPVVIDITSNPSDNILDLLDANPLQLYRFPFRGENYVGILNKGGFAPSTHAPQQYQLLSVPENNLSSLIEYYGT